MGKGLNDKIESENDVTSLMSALEKTAETIAVKARAINRLLEWKRNPGYAEFVNGKLEIVEEYKKLVKDEYKEFSNVVREAYLKKDIALGFSVCKAIYKMFEDYISLANEKNDNLFYQLGLAYFNSYQARFYLLVEKKELAKRTMQKSKRHYNQAINLNLDTKTKEKIQKILKKTDLYLKRYKPRNRKRVPTIGITEEDLQDQKNLDAKIQRICAKLNKNHPHLFDMINYQDDSNADPSYDEILKEYLDGELDSKDNVA